MKIKNDFVIINHNGKQTKLHNMILNTYIQNIIDNQTILSDRASLSMDYVYIRFDSPLTFDKTSVLQESDFDLRISHFNTNTQITPMQITLNYFYKVDNTQNSVYDIQLEQYLSNIEAYINKPITAIGFGTSDIYACVNTLNYNIRIESLDTVFSVARRDIITTDVIFSCPSKLVKGAVHLCNGQNVYVDYFPESRYIGILESIGLGLIPQRMDQEISLIPYEDHLSYETNKILISDELTIEYYSDGLFPAEDIYPSDELYPARMINQPLYPSYDIFPAEDLYMIESSYLYVQLKYKIYNQDIIEGTTTDTGKYYLLSKFIGGKEKIKMNIEYES